MAKKRLPKAVRIGERCRVSMRKQDGEYSIRGYVNGKLNSETFEYDLPAARGTMAAEIKWYRKYPQICGRRR